MLEWLIISGRYVRLYVYYFYIFYSFWIVCMILICSTFWSTMSIFSNPQRGYLHIKKRWKKEQNATRAWGRGEDFIVSHRQFRAVLAPRNCFSGRKAVPSLHPWIQSAKFKIHSLFECKRLPPAEIKANLQCLSTSQFATSCLWPVLTQRMLTLIFWSGLHNIRWFNTFTVSLIMFESGTLIWCSALNSRIPLWTPLQVFKAILIAWDLAFKLYVSMQCNAIASIPTTP